MKKVLLLTVLVLTSCHTLMAGSPGTIDDGIGKYVDLDKRPTMLSKPQFTPDGTATVDLVDGKRIVTRDIRSGKELETLFDVSNTRDTRLDDIEGFTISDKGNTIMVWRNVKKIYRHSFTAEYYTYDCHSRILTPLSSANTPQRAPLMSPDGLMVAFVAPDNNIWLRKLNYNTEIAVTKDGKANEVINGVPDWTYEEEFATTQSMAWSPDNLILCFLKYNETQVPQYGFPLYGGACDTDSRYSLYPGTYDYKYPVAGEPNSVVTLHSYDVELRKIKTVTLDPKVEYIPRIMYGDTPERLLTVTLNRAQNRMELYSVNPRSLVKTSLMVEESRAWIDPMTYENIAVDDEGFVIFSSRSGYRHLYRYGFNGQMIRQLTKGEYDVTDYYGYDPKSRRYFYQSASSSPINRVVSTVDAKDVVKNLSPLQGTASGWLYPNGDYFTMGYSSATQVPVFKLYSTSGDKELMLLEDNSDYASRYSNEPVKEFFTFTSEDGVELNGYMVKPLDFNASRRYPVIMYQYSGPGSQQVLNKWSCDWVNYFARQGFIIMCVDGRGTGGRGAKFMNMVYLNLGHYETIDQAAAARYAASLPYVDGRNIGIHGWSYGGYETLMAVSAGLFDYAAGVAVAPVTDWRYYDTVYTERYMLTPQQNSEGYEQSAPINYVDKVGCPLLIMHGTADDNVHLSNTMEYVSEMEAAARYCDMLVFPNMNHSIYGCNSRRVVYGRMLDYFKAHLNN